jgi:hypothetical protein
MGSGAMGCGTIGGGGSGVATDCTLPTKIVCAEPTSADGAAAAGAASGVPQRPQNAKPGGLWNAQLVQVPGAGAGITGAPVGALPPTVPPDPLGANCIGNPGAATPEGGPIGAGEASGDVGPEPIGAAGIGPLVCGATGCGAVDCCGRGDAVGPDGCTGIAPVGADPNACRGIASTGAGGAGGGPRGAG